jgi:hypothetical protein
MFVLQAPEHMRHLDEQVLRHLNIPSICPRKPTNQSAMRAVAAEG